jgi:hypothetical protein
VRRVIAATTTLLLITIAHRYSVHSLHQETLEVNSTCFVEAERINGPC